MAKGRLYKRGKAWYLDVHTGRKTGGKPERIQRRATGTTKAEAQAELDEFLYSLRRSAATGAAINNVFPLASVVENWCEHIDRTYTNREVAAEYQRHARRILAELDIEFVADLTLAAVEIAMAAIAERMSTNAANKSLAKLKAAMEYARESNLIATNPIKKARQLRTVRKKFRRALYPEEIAAVLSHAPEPWRTIWHLFLATGFRRDEFRQLETKDIDLRRKKITIYESSKFKPKTEAGNRTIPLGEKIVAALHKCKLGREIAFPGERGGMIAERALLDTFRKHFTAAMIHLTEQRIKRGCEIPLGVTPCGSGKFEVDTSEIDLHSMRKTFVTELIATGIDPKSVQYLAGHKDINTTLKIYADLRGGNPAEAITKIPWA